MSTTVPASAEGVSRASVVVQYLMQGGEGNEARAREILEHLRSDDLAALEDAARLLEWHVSDVLMQRPMDSPLHGNP